MEESPQTPGAPHVQQVLQMQQALQAQHALHALQAQQAIQAQQVLQNQQVQHAQDKLSGSAPQQVPPLPIQFPPGLIPLTQGTGPLSWQLVPSANQWGTPQSGYSSVYTMGTQPTLSPESQQSRNVSLTPEQFALFTNMMGKHQN